MLGARATQEIVMQLPKTAYATLRALLISNRSHEFFKTLLEQLKEA